MKLFRIVYVSRAAEAVSDGLRVRDGLAAADDADAEVRAEAVAFLRDAARELAKKEGIFVGISSGGTFAAALEVAKQAKPGDVILAMLPDTGERYLSTPLYSEYLN